MSHDADCSGCPECALPRRGPAGSAPTEAYYRSRGYHRLQLRLPLDAIDLLDTLAERLTDEFDRLGEGERKVSRSEALDALLREPYDVAELAAGIRLRRAG